MSFLRKWLRRNPNLKHLIKAIAVSLGLFRAESGGLAKIRKKNLNDEIQRLDAVWKNEQLPGRQRTLVDDQLNAYRSGQRIKVFDIFIDAIRSTNLNAGKLLEVGCSSAYYYEVMQINNSGLTYFGCDFSRPFIDLGKKFYPNVQLSVQDATRLDFGDDEFDIVVSGCCILHIPEYETAVRETSRVARQFAIFHRTPFVRGLPNQYYRKIAYGIEMVEIHFNEGELIDLFSTCGLELIRTIVIEEAADNDFSSVTRGISTYICRKLENAL